MEGYKWEAHKVILDDGYEKILFRITGNSRELGFMATKEPILMVNGASSNVMQWFVPTYALQGPRTNYVAKVDSKFIALVKDYDPTRRTWMETMKEYFPERWE